MRGPVGIAVMVAAAGLVSACGGKSDAEKKAEAAKSGRGTVTCSGTPLSGTTGLPAGFPTAGGVVYVEATTKGPTRIVDGYATQTVKQMHDLYRTGFSNARYTVLADELEKDDSELSYRAKDKKTEGQVALRACDEHTTSVHITNRPAA